jgi:hypothetical protein
VYFDFAMARVRGRSWPLLEQIAQLLEAHPEYVAVSIEGHCDDVGNNVVNQRLSQRRAERVRNHLLRRHRVAEERIRAVGFGRSRPLVRQTTESARQRNRRVEFRIVGIDRSVQAGQALPRRGREVAPELGPGGVVIPEGEEGNEASVDDSEMTPDEGDELSEDDAETENDSGDVVGEDEEGGEGEPVASEDEEAASEEPEEAR